MTNSNKTTTHFQIVDMITNEVIESEVTFSKTASFSLNCLFDILDKKGLNVILTKWSQGEEKVTKLRKTGGE